MELELGHWVSDLDWVRWLGSQAGGVPIIRRLGQRPPGRFRSWVKNYNPVPTSWDAVVYKLIIAGRHSTILPLSMAWLGYLFEDGCLPSPPFLSPLLPHLFLLPSVIGYPNVPPQRKKTFTVFKCPYLHFRALATFENTVTSAKEVMFSSTYVTLFVC